MFYVNVDTQLFCKSPEEPKRSGDKPWFRHLEGKTPIFPTSFFAANYLASDDPVFAEFLSGVPDELKAHLGECEWDGE